MTRRASRLRRLAGARSADGDAGSDSRGREPRLARIEHATLYVKVYDELRNALMSGAYVPGETLTIRGVAEALGTSVMPVREALHRLAAERGVEILANRAIRVPMLDARRFEELLQLRLLLEGRAVGLAAEVITRAELNEARRINAAFAASGAGQPEARLLANRQFHFAIYRAARSPLMMSVIEMMWLQSGPCLTAPTQWPAARGGETYFAAGVAHHRELLDALARRDSAAASKAVQADIRDAARAYRDGLGRATGDARRALG